MRHTSFWLAAITLAALALSACDAPLPTVGSSTAAPPSGPSLTPGAGIAVTPLARGTVEPFHIATRYEGHLTVLQSPKASDIVVNSAILAPGGTTGWHAHPGPVIGTIKSGTFTLYDAGRCKAIRYPAGRAFIEPGGLADRHVGRNEGDVPVEWVATLIVGVGVATRIDLPAPADCPH
jgi:quercetin dioxygenase-like cupin family protein